MVLFSQVSGFVADEVINNVGRGHNEPSVQANRPTSRATSPSRLLIPEFEILVLDAHALGVVVSTVSEIVPRPPPIEVFEYLLDRRLFYSTLS